MEVESQITQRKPTAPIAEVPIDAAMPQEGQAPPIPPVPATPKAAPGCGWIAWIIGIVGVIYVFQGCSGDTSKTTTLADASAATIIVGCRSSVRDKLKAPSSAKFIDNSEPIFSGGSWSYSGAVDSQNSFGAMIRTPYVCSISGATIDSAIVSTVLLD